MKPIAVTLAFAVIAFSAPAYAAFPTAVNDQITDKTGPSGRNGHDKQGAHFSRSTVNAQITDKTRSGMHHRHF